MLFCKSGEYKYAFMFASICKKHWEDMKETNKIRARWDE